MRSEARRCTVHAGRAKPFLNTLPSFKQIDPRGQGTVAFATGRHGHYQWHMFRTNCGADCGLEKFRSLAPWILRRRKSRGEAALFPVQHALFAAHGSQYGAKVDI